MQVDHQTDVKETPCFLNVHLMAVTIYLAAVFQMPGSFTNVETT